MTDNHMSRVLVTGASGGVGLAAVQLALLRGAVVTGQCSLGKAAVVRNMGATILDRGAPGARYPRGDGAAGAGTALMPTSPPWAVPGPQSAFSGEAFTRRRRDGERRGLGTFFRLAHVGSSPTWRSHQILIYGRRFRLR